MVAKECFTKIFQGKYTFYSRASLAGASAQHSRLVSFVKKFDANSAPASLQKIVR